MEKDMDRTDRFFRERLVNFEQKPDEELWTAITGRLDQNRHKRMVYLFIRIAAGMTLVFSLGLGYYLLNNKNKQAQPSILSFKATDNHKDSVSAGSEKPHVNQVERKKKEKSERMPPVRKVHKSPEISYQDVVANPAAREAPDQLLDKRDYTGQDKTETEDLIPVYSRLAVLSVPVPAKLDHSAKARPAAGNLNLLSGVEEFPGEDDKVSRPNPWKLGGEIAPLYSYRTIASDYLASSLKNSMNNSEGSLIAYAGGIRVGWSASRRLSVQSGVYYSRYGQEKGNVEEYKTDMGNSMEMKSSTFLSIPNSTGTIVAANKKEMSDERVVVNSADSKAGPIFDSHYAAINTVGLVPLEGNDLSAMQYFDYLELPVNLKYKIIDRKFGFSFIGGLVTNFLVGNKVVLTKNGDRQQIGKTTDINRVNYLGSIGLGFEYPVIKKIAFSLEPRFRYYINPIDESFNIHPYSFGIFAGFSMGL